MRSVTNELDNMQMKANRLIWDTRNIRQLPGTGKP